MRSSSIGLLAALTFMLTPHLTWGQPPAGPEGPRRPEGRPGGREFRPFPHPLVAALDADRDGEISAAELQGAAESLKQLDRNKDGKLAGEEIGPPRGRFGGPRFGPPRGSREESPPKANSEEEKRILEVLDEMDRNERRGMMNVPVEDGRLLRLLTEAVHAKHVVEIGTSNGYSGIWFCLALRTTGGKLTTHEIDAQRAALARKNFKRAGVEEMVTLVEGDAHEVITKLSGPIDVAFIDADKEGYPDYLRKLLPLVRPGGLILAHNTRMGGGGITAYLNAVTTNPQLETLLLHMQGAGVGVTLKKRD